MSQPRARNGQYAKRTAERVTETTTTNRVTERVIVEEAETLEALPAITDEVNWAGGWNPGTYPDQAKYRLQRQGQQDQCLWFLVMSAQSGADDDWARRETLRAAKTILRAGPGATPLELTMGRSI